MSNFKRNLKWYVLGTLFLAAVLVWLAVLAYQPSGFLEVNFFDVGQGDAIFIEAPSGNQVLIDGGPSRTVLAKLGRLMPFWDRTIDLLILTHPHYDHLAGLIEVLKRYKIGMVLMPNESIKTAAFKEFLRTIEEKNIPVKYAKAGMIIHFGKGSGAAFYVLSPKTAAELEFDEHSEGFGGKGMSLNESSIVGKLIYGKAKFLLTGDAGVETEQKLLAPGHNLTAGVLKVGHHGSRYSTSEDFLKAVSPVYAVISVGAGNRYGHPVPEILERLQNFGAKILRTDLNGDIVIKTDGKNYLVK
ncbi:MAG: ComEC/Rec2 family competence protein [Patescibacteria group bacterium]